MPLALWHVTSAHRRYVGGWIISLPRGRGTLEGGRRAGGRLFLAGAHIALWKVQRAPKTDKTTFHSATCRHGTAHGYRAVRIRSWKIQHRELNPPNKYKHLMTQVSKKIPPYLCWNNWALRCIVCFWHLKPFVHMAKHLVWKSTYLHTYNTHQALNSFKRCLSPIISTHNWLNFPRPK